jgi:ribosomal protein S7
MEQRKKQHKKTLYTSFLNNFILKGKKGVTKKSVDNGLSKLCQGLSISIIKMLFQIYTKLDYFIEIKQVKIKRRTYTIPFSITYNRRIYLILKKIKAAIKLDRRQIAFSEKLRFELYNILNFPRNSGAIKLLKNHQALLRSSRSNIHFRWK